MSLIVMKFGGSSLDGAMRLHHAAERIAEAYHKGKDVVAVLSARGDTTDRLIETANRIARDPPNRELDLLLSVGEQISVAHMAMQLAELGCPAVGFTGWQAGIRTDGRFGDAKVHYVAGGRLRRALDARNIVLVTGFQGISEAGDITTLGRGGSDTTAVALAIWLQADLCHIYTDVDGVYTADPRILPEARKLERISYEDMLEMARQGAKVLHSRCVELAKESGLRFEVRSSFSELSGTQVGPEEGRTFCGLASVNGVQLPNVSEPAARVSLIGSACGDQEMVVQVLRALGGQHLYQITRRSRCISAYVPESEAVEAARILHEQFLT